MQELPRERLGVGAQALGAIEGALALTLEYVSQREAFGQRIADFQNTRFTLAQIKAQLEMARAYFDQCVERYRQGTMSMVATATPRSTPFHAFIWMHGYKRFTPAAPRS